ncbi:MAG: gluconate:H+ symporter, partial [Bacteroidota bacterium]
MPLLIIALGIAVLLLLIIRFKFNAFIALILVAMGVGVAMGMTPGEAVAAIQKGVGDTLGSLALILGFGAMLGAMIAESGAAKVISQRLIQAFGINRIAWAMVLTGFIIGVPMFFSVGFLVIIPIIYSVAKETKLPLLYVGIPMVAALSVTHGFLPPHPAPATIVGFFKADMQLTLLYGLALAIPTIILSGVIFGKTFRRFETTFPEHLFKMKENENGRLPSFGLSVFTALIPVILMALGGVAKLTLAEGHLITQALNFLGDPVISLLLAVLIAVWTLGIHQGRRLGDVMNSLTDSVKPIAIIILLLGGGGAFKEVLVQSGISNYIVEGMQGIDIPPLVMAW